MNYLPLVPIALLCLGVFIQARINYLQQRRVTVLKSWIDRRLMALELRCDLETPPEPEEELCDQS